MEVRSARTHAELHACIDLMIRVWNLDPLEAVPFHQLYTAHEWGGRVIVAVEGGEVVGFSYGFGGRQYGRPALLSHILAVQPSHRARGTGMALKLTQGRWALENGYDLITWTYDPLEAVNANLNIARLGGEVRQYLVNHYGEMTDGINRGLPSDRLLLEWHLRSPRAAAAMKGAPVPEPPSGAREVEIPRDIQSIKSEDPDLALRWRLRVRAELQSALAEGYSINGFAKQGDRCAYLLTQGTEENHAN